MRPPTPTARLPPVGVVLLLALVLLPPADAQAPPGDSPSAQEGAFSLSVAAQPAFIQVPYNARATTTLAVRDTSEDSGKTPLGTPSTDAASHTIELVVRNGDELRASGWDCQIGTTSFPSYGGRTVTLDVGMLTTPLVKTQDAVCVIDVVLVDGETGTRLNVTATVNAEVSYFTKAYASVTQATQVQVAGQFETVRYEVVIQNFGVYPDVYRIEAEADKDGFLVNDLPNVYVPAQSSRVVNVTVRTPHGAFYEFGETTGIAIGVYSTTGAGAYTVTGVLKVEGWYIPAYVFPLLLVGGVSAGVVARGSREWRELRRLEKGRPRRIEPTPRQAVLLATMRKDDPEGYKAYKAKMDALYKARRERFKAEKAAVAARDKEEEKLAAAEYKAAKLRKKAEKAEAKRLRKIEKKAAKAQRKIDRKQAKVDAKERKKLEKELAQKRKVLEKRKAKLDKANAKQAAKDAKAQAKADAAAAKLAMKEARAAAKAAKKGRDGKP